MFNEFIYSFFRILFFTSNLSKKTWCIALIGDIHIFEYYIKYYIEYDIEYYIEYYIEYVYINYIKIFLNSIKT